MIRTLFYSSDKKLRTGLTNEELKSVLEAADGLLWMDFEATAADMDEKILTGLFGFHPLAVDDALQETHIPKVDDWGSYLYIVLSPIVFEKSDGSLIEIRELDVFLGKNYLVTHHDQSLAAVERTWDACQRDERHINQGADHLLYRLIDEMVAQYMPVVEKIDDEIDDIQAEVFDRPGPDVLSRIFDMKRSALQLRRVIGPEREVLNKLARDDYEVIDSRARVYFRDVYDHLVRLHDLTESLRDLISGALDTYLSVINNRMNDIMKTLTIITTLFMPISFVVGFFGMNYFYPIANTDDWTSLPAFWVTLGIIVLLPAGMLAWVRRRGWM
jgi:magnesium transporter